MKEKFYFGDIVSNGNIIIDSLRSEDQCFLLRIVLEKPFSQVIDCDQYTVKIHLISTNAVYHSSVLELHKSNGHLSFPGSPSVKQFKNNVSLLLRFTLYITYHPAMLKRSIRASSVERIWLRYILHHFPKGTFYRLLYHHLNLQWWWHFD